MQGEIKLLEYVYEYARLEKRHAAIVFSPPRSFRLSPR